VQARYYHMDLALAWDHDKPTKKAFARLLIISLFIL